MSLSLLIRSPVVRRQLSSRARSLHTTAPARSAHGEYHHLPFKLPGPNQKPLFALKVALYMVGGFSIPFLCARHQLTKSQGGA